MTKQNYSAEEWKDGNPLRFTVTLTPSESRTFMQAKSAPLWQLMKGTAVAKMLLLSGMKQHCADMGGVDVQRALPLTAKRIGRRMPKPAKGKRK